MSIANPPPPRFSHVADPPLEEGSPLGAGIDFTDPTSPLARYYFRASHVIAAALLGLIFVFFSYVPLWHTDIWGHLTFGRWIVEHGRLPDREPFCPLADAQSSSLHAYWLIQAGLYQLFHLGETLAGGDEFQQLAGGAEVLRLTLAAVLLLRCVVLLTAFRRLSHSLPLACVCVVLMLLASVGHITVMRPQAFAELFFAVVLLGMVRQRDPEGLSRRAMLILPVVMVLWANMHGSYPGGLMLLGACLAGRFVSAWWEKRQEGIRGRASTDTGVRRWLVTVVLALGGIALANPHGPAIYLHTLQMSRHPNVHTMDEWQPLMRNPTGALAWLWVGSLILLIGAQLLSSRWYTPTEWLLIAGFALGPLVHLRMMIWWFMVVPWLLCAQWPAIRQELSWSFFDYSSIPSLRKTMLAGLMLVVVLSLSAPAQWLTAGKPAPLSRVIYKGTPWQLAAQLQGKPGPDGEELPALGEALTKHYPHGRYRGPIFASETQGDYLVWALAPQHGIFLYTHVHLFPNEVWQQCTEVKFGLPSWRQGAGLPSHQPGGGGGRDVSPAARLARERPGLDHRGGRNGPDRQAGQPGPTPYCLANETPLRRGTLHALRHPPERSSAPRSWYHGRG
jgi:hypothetical protein